jgi:hypothetical protein
VQEQQKSLKTEDYMQMNSFDDANDHFAAQEPI